MSIPTAAYSDCTSADAPLQPSPFPDLAEQRVILDGINLDPIVEAVSIPYAGVGPRPYDRRPIVRAHLLSYIHPSPVGSVTALHRTLLNNPAARDVCGFTNRVPSRVTLSRVFSDMAEYPETMEEIMDELVRKASEFLPGLGDDLAVDSTPVQSYANGNAEPSTDPDARWGRHQKANTKDGFEWVYGYKLHLAADANHDFPISMKLTPGSVHDSPMMIPLVEGAERRLNEFPRAVIADRGYDSERNSEWVDGRGAAPIIHKRRPKSGLHRGEYATDGVPVCECGKKRGYLFTNPDSGVHYYGRAPECASEDEDSLCFMEILVNPREDVRLFGGSVRRGSAEWKKTYRKRWSVERVFSRWKVEGRLNDHRFRQSETIRLHAMLQMLALQATILARLRVERYGWVAA